MLVWFPSISGPTGSFLEESLPNKSAITKDSKERLYKSRFETKKCEIAHCKRKFLKSAKCGPDVGVM